LRQNIRRTALLLAGVVLLGAGGPGAKPNVVTVVARDFSLDLPASIPAGLTTFHLVNRGKQEHHMTVVRLGQGKTAAEALKAIIDAGKGPRPVWLHQVGGPQALMPRTEGNATLVLEPGDYLAFCEVPGPDPAPHFMKGMAKAFTVTGPSRPGVLPAADVALSLSDYDFTFDHPLTRGRHTVAVTNSASQPHMLVMMRFPPKQGMKQFIDWAMNPQGKLSPGHAAGGVTEIPPGATVVFSENFPPGRYGMICFSPDPTDGKPHFVHGMQKEFDVP
jgi:hypothetical protein